MRFERIFLAYKARFVPRLIRRKLPSRFELDSQVYETCASPTMLQKRRRGACKCVLPLTALQERHPMSRLPRAANKIRTCYLCLTKAAHIHMCFSGESGPCRIRTYNPRLVRTMRSHCAKGPDDATPPAHRRGFTPMTNTGLEPVTFAVSRRRAPNCANWSGAG
jgi:hypothetical protein